MREDRFTLTTLTGIYKVSKNHTMKMTNEEAKELTDNVFKLIQSKNLSSVLHLHLLKAYKKNYIDPDASPRIEFTISKTDFENINQQLNDDLTFKRDTKILDSLAKLLYAVAWKNGDLKKIRHIIEGIKEAHLNQDNKKDALVFYNFGKYVAKPEEHPIVDQHVIRAFLVYKAKTDEEIDQHRKLNDSQKIKKEYVDEYKNWLTEFGNSFDDIEKRKDFFYEVDRHLFALGKTIKTK